MKNNDYAEIPASSSNVVQGWDLNKEKISKFSVGNEYKARSDFGNSEFYKLEWIDTSAQTCGVALWRSKGGVLHLQNICDFQDSQNMKKEIK